MNKHFLSKIGFLLLLIIIISICAVSKTTTYESFTEIRLERLMNQFKKQNNKYEIKLIEALTNYEINDKNCYIDRRNLPCSEKYIEVNGSGLCREMFCLMQTRGIDAKVSQTQCESIANIKNNLSMLQYCTPTITSNMTKEHLESIKEER